MSITTTITVNGRGGVTAVGSKAYIMLSGMWIGLVRTSAVIA
jgi:hypothetical protein